MKIILDLNQYVKQTVQKVVQPLLLQNDCKDYKIDTSSWVFVKCSPKPSEKKWGKLAGWEVEESLQAQTIQVYGKLKIKQKTMYLQLYMKLKAAIENPKQDQYYSCKLQLGPCSRKNLTTRSQKALITFEITLQDLKFEFEVEHCKPCKNLRI